MPAPGARSIAKALSVSGGFTLVELLLALSIAVVSMSVAVPATRDALDALRTGMAARAVSARLASLRMDAVSQSRCFGLRFEAAGEDYRFATVADGNGNGVRSADIAAGVDAAVSLKERLSDKFPGVTFGLMNGYPDADLVGGTGADGVRIGRALILTLSPDGTATAGTLYLHGRRAQYAIRILGATGRVRVLQYLPGTGTWLPL
jgi:prepilin-type N-terminal cleavage/methylation domain-containing protein